MFGRYLSGDVRLDKSYEFEEFRIRNEIWYFIESSELSLDRKVFFVFFCMWILVWNFQICVFSLEFRKIKWDYDRLGENFSKNFRVQVRYEVGIRRVQVEE